MEAETIIEVIDKLIGKIEPIGVSEDDAVSLQNLEKHITIVERMVDKLDYISYYYQGDQRGSVQRNRDKAYKAIVRLCKSFEDFEFDEED